MHGISKNEKNLVRAIYGPSEASYGYTVHGWGLQGVYKGLQGVYKGYLHYLHLKLLLMLTTICIGLRLNSGLQMPNIIESWKASPFWN